MSHFNVCVLVPLQPVGENDGDEAIQEKYVEYVNATLGKFDIEREVPAYKRYLDDEEIESVSNYYKLPKQDLKELADKLSDWNGMPGEVDEKGLYELTTRNPDSRVDYWSVVGYVDPKEYEDAFLGLETGKIIAALVTPDGKWIQGPYFYGPPNDEKTKKELADWENLIRKTLQEHVDDLAFLVDCHI